MVELQNPATGERTTEIRAELDSGAEYSLFEGQLAVSIGINIFAGEPFAFRLANGTGLETRVLPVLVLHPELGAVPLRIRFTTGPSPINILGWDFFDFVLVGFDEHHSEVYLSLRQ